ncbi:hypothetical protein ACFX2I_025151 [Malus domestica]
MVHVASIDSGSASYACRFTETQRLVQEREMGQQVFPKAIGELHGHSGIACLLLFFARGALGSSIKTRAQASQTPAWSTTTAAS